jgi:hypothetical protein
MKFAALFLFFLAAAGLPAGEPLIAGPYEQAARPIQPGNPGPEVLPSPVQPSGAGGDKQPDPDQSWVLGGGDSEKPAPGAGLNKQPAAGRNRVRSEGDSKNPPPGQKEGAAPPEDQKASPGPEDRRDRVYALPKNALDLARQAAVPGPVRQDSAGVPALSEKLIRELNIQTSLPKDGPSYQRPNLNAPILSLILMTLFWLTAASVLSLIAVTIYRHLRKASPKKPAAPPDPALLKTIQGLESEARTHYQSGRLAEAIHTLLIRGLEEFQKYRSTVFSPHLTSREILASLKLGPPIEPALAVLVLKVEQSRFALWEPAEADYQLSLKSFQELCRALGAKT